MPRIQCPTCEASYDLPLESIGQAGRKVRCAACKTLWVASAALPEPEIAVVEVEAGFADIASAPQVLPARPWYERFKPAETAVALPSGRRVAGYLLVAACLAGAVVLRKSIVAAVPETGAAFAALGMPVNLRGFDLRGVHSSLTSEGGGDMLVVQGEIINVSKDKKALPRLHFTVRDERGLTLYSWTAQADAKDLQPGQSLQFRRRLASPPGEGRDVLVRFATRADLVAAVQ